MTAALLLVFAAAKLLALAGRHVALTWWTPIAYVWEDAVVVLAFAIAARLVPRLSTIAYAILAVYCAINVPVARVVSTPLTLPMWRAARGPLADSIRLYLTPTNAAMIAGVCAIAAIAPRLLRSLKPAAVYTLHAGLVLCAALGPAAMRRVDTPGAERNAWMTLATTSLPRVGAAPSADEWTAVGFDRTVDGDLAAFHGAAAGRNVVFVSLESTAAQYLGLYGAQPDPMPNLSALARSAIVFDAAYAVYPESIKGLFSTLCSKYPAIDRAADAYANAPCDSMPSVLREHGYRTALFHSGRFAYLGMDAIVRNRGYDVLADAADLGAARESSFGVDEPSTVAHILRWIDSLPRGQRFFVTYLPIAGHHPYDSPERGPFPDREEIGRYRNALHYGDASLGALVDGIAARGLADQTLWVVIGDHGEAFGQHDGNIGHTFQIYDENVHVPFIVAGQGLSAAQRRGRRVVSLIDVAPTLLDLTGIGAPASHEGRSALDADARLAFFFADYSRVLVGLRDGPMKFIDDVESGRGRLFDLSRDPAETADLTGAFPGRAAWYRRNLQSFRARQASAIVSRP